MNASRIGTAYHAAAVSFLEAVQAIDETVLLAARGSPGWAVPLFYAFTVVGAGWGLIALLPFLLHPVTRKPTLWLFAAVAATSALVSLIKIVVGRVRPCDALGWCAPISIASPGGGSFPSGHAAGSFAFAAFVAAREPRLAMLVVPYAVVVAWSRCVLGVHYPSDVFVGALLGAGIGFALSRRAAQKRATPAAAFQGSGTPV
jgi:undecaprenyl-diphosphatase